MFGPAHEGFIMALLQFVCGAGISSRLIAWWGCGYGGFSHVDAVMPDGSLLGARWDRCGDQDPGVRVRPPEYERWTRRSILKIPLEAQQELAWQQWLMGQVGRKYDSRAIIGFITGRAVHDAGHWICSALQYEGLVEAKWFPQLALAPQQVTPNELHAMCLVRGATVWRTRDA